MNLLSLTFVGILFITKSHSQEVKNVNSCYYCESSKHGNCTDFVIGRGNATNCVDFVLDEEPPMIDVRVGGGNRARTELGLITDFRCVKLRVTHRGNPQEETIRMCAPITKEITSACQNLRMNTEDDFSIKTCLECNKDNCNASWTLHQDNLLRLIFAGLIYLLTF